MERLVSLPHFKSYVALLVVYLVWGTTFGAIRIGVETISPAMLVFLRFTLAGVLLIVFCLMKGERLPEWASLKRELIVGFLLFFGGNSIVCWAVQYVPTGIGGALTATNPFWMVALAALFPPHERISATVLLGLLIGFLGILLLLLPKLMMPMAMSPLFWVGILALLLMVFFWAAGSLFVRKTQSSASLLMSLGIQNLFAGTLLTPFVFHSSETWAPSTSSLIALAYLILMGTIVTTPCYYYVLKTLPVALSSTFAYVTPVITILFGWLFLGEQMTIYTALGTGLILAGVLVVQCFSRKVDRPEISPIKHAQRVT